MFVRENAVSYFLDVPGRSYLSVGFYMCCSLLNSCENGNHNKASQLVHKNRKTGAKKIPITIVLHSSHLFSFLQPAFGPCVLFIIKYK